MNVYNRWGERVYTSQDKNSFWDGRQNGLPAPAGTYMYLVAITHALTGKVILRKGK